MKKLYFVRHGQTIMNVQGMLSSRTDTPLTDTGRAQAIATGKEMKKRGIQPDCIIASPLSRALDTAKLIAQEVGYDQNKIITDDNLMERDFGKLENTPWGTQIFADEDNGVESDEALVARARLALDKVESLHADIILVVAHGAIGRALRSLVRDDFPMSHPHRIGNAELVELL